MNKKMSRLKGLFLSCLSVMMIVVCICSFSFESKAKSYVAEVMCNEPLADNNHGYLVTYHASGNIHVFYWTNVNNSDRTIIDCMVNLKINTNEVTFMATSTGAGYFGLYEFYQPSSQKNYEYSLVDTTYNGSHQYTYNTSDSIVAFMSRGQVQLVDESLAFQSDSLTVTWGAETLLGIQLDKIISYLSALESNSEVGAVLGNMLKHLGYIIDEVDEVEEILKQINYSIEYYALELESELEESNENLKSILDKLDEMSNIEKLQLEEQKKSNTWLEKIWNSIQEFISPSEEDKQASEELKNETTEKSDTLDDLNEQNKTDKTDIDSASGSVDENVDLDSIDNYGGVLACITENEYILQILLLVFSVALVGYVLFGKR